MVFKRSLVAACLMSFLAAAALSGCAFGNFGKADMTYSEINAPSGLVGLAKPDVIRTLGVPDSVAQAGKTEYWGYKNKAGFFVILFGKTIQKDLVLEFKDSKVTSSYMFDKGSSIGILAAQGSVAE